MTARHAGLHLRCSREVSRLRVHFRGLNDALQAKQPVNLAPACTATHYKLDIHAISRDKCPCRQTYQVEPAKLQAIHA